MYYKKVFLFLFFSVPVTWGLAQDWHLASSHQAVRTRIEPTKCKSFYTQRPEDPDAVYFTPSDFPERADGKTDVSDALQQAINLVKTKYNFGILFIPEGKYLISKTIFIPPAVRLIGYGTNRPEIILQKNAPGFQFPDSADKGKAKYMFWFTGGMFQDGQPVWDANAGTFYSAFSNIDIKIDKGNSNAVALRTHFAQHSFIAHVDIHIGDGKAGIFDVGNEIEDARFFGGSYGIYTTKPSPGWQFMMVDTYFEGQRKAAIKTQEAGLTIVRMQVKKVPTVIDVDSNYHEKIFIEEGVFDEVSGPAMIISNEANAFTQVNIRNVLCRRVPVFSQLRQSKQMIAAPGNIYRVKNYSYGWQIDELGQEPVCRTDKEMSVEQNFNTSFACSLPQLPPMQAWVNVKTLGAKGDGITDDTKVLQDAIDRYATIYVPQGWYKITGTLYLKPNTALIGLHPMATQFLIDDHSEAFGGFGGPQPLVVAPKGGTNILTGIGLNTGAYNNRAVACKWMAGEHSYMNDVKFVGGHGSMARPASQPSGSQGRNRSGGGNTASSRILPGIDAAWDTQYWSLWITDGGGGTFKDIWTANTFSSSGLYVSNTSTPSKVYAMSVEHHVRNEVRFKNVSNWKIYALQLEEESRESSFAQPLEIEGCEHLVFANLYMFRVIRVNTPYPYSIRSWNNKNIELLNVHNYSQTKYTSTLPLYDINADQEVRPWEFARLFISGNDTRKKVANTEKYKIQQLAKGFEYADGICRDSKGNIYFSESRQKRIYKWSIESQSLSMIADFPWEPLSLGCDRNDRLLVVFKYVPRPGYLQDGKPEVIPTLPDTKGTSFSGWGNSGFGVWVYSIDPENPEASIQLLPKVPMASVHNLYKSLYPSNRWRDYHDFNKVTVNKPKEAFLAMDGVTIIPEVYDLARSNALIEAFPGKTVYATDEYDKRTVRLQVSREGYLDSLQYFAERGEYNNVTDSAGNLYIADGQIYIYDASGKQKGMIEVPERPVTICLAGKDGRSLFITTRSSLYCSTIY
ncbi:SMP-30/gluconolactonase/LRE family protein [Chitinophagaceae bacterium LB-8]|uniref:SMP-30/gluconolactonase/LRE family protein n=1 Tax=Paraflavisolibacter caeni TaxID=2982496 RepID=A0A9X2XV16_9BACT|nr:glycosyl hydrolase family 28-related protein [Paraflavisolibacter caeni]MCU7549814.1 SMP-30/gluconolactonase/LRE family protein [Paraflavisolibacter caeni]